jgi:hypothetical protein
MGLVHKATVKSNFVFDEASFIEIKLDFYGQGRSIYVPISLFLDKFECQDDRKTLHY